MCDKNSLKMLQLLKIKLFSITLVINKLLQKILVYIHLNKMTFT